MKSRIFAGMMTLILLLTATAMVFCPISSAKAITANKTSNLNINNTSNLDINKNNYILELVLLVSKRYQEDPKEFNKDYIAYLSAGTTMTPTEKLKKYFGLEINRKLFEDAMDIVDLRVKH